MDVTYTHMTYLTAIDRSRVIELQPIPTGAEISFVSKGGLKGEIGEPGIQGPAGQNGAANIPEVMDGGNF